ncbi:carcinine transporter-like [Ctenocephalides felis]|uniref:carcinine transporter-like n=1 Tax=Ctenocephalides felis TaxID=7515 RepID=UPI000E6E3DAB|nr:carcinine transporter-like [Ctenocephalides felis]
MPHDKDAVFDKVMQSVGDDGAFQKRFNYFYNTAMVALTVMPYINIVMMMAVPDHWCHVPGRNETNYSLEEWKALTLPREYNSKGQIDYSSCNMYNKSWSEETNKIESQIIPCQHGYEYDRTWYLSTAPSDQDWVCDRELYVTNTFAIGRAGEVIGTFIFGQLGDRIGRRPVFYLSLITIVTGRLITAFTSSWFIVFITAAFLGSLTSTSVFQSPLIIAMEISRSEDRAHIAMMQSIGWTSGMILMPLLMWATRDWFIFALVSTIPCTIFLIHNKYMIESPRWLASRCKIERCENTLKIISSVNKTTLNEDAIRVLREKSSGKPEKVYGIMSLFSSLRLARNTTLIVLCWIVCSVTYFTLILNVSNMGGNPFLNFLYQSAVELPAYLLGRFSSDRIGRRWTSVASFGIALAASSILICIANDESLQNLVPLLAVVMKFCISITFYVVNLQAMETYPTFEMVLLSYVAFSKGQPTDYPILDIIWLQFF